MVIYFSGTGNSRYCARMLAAGLGDECMDSFNYIKNQIAAELISGKPWVFVAPTYCWQLPHLFEKFIETGSFEGNRDAYFVMTCGSDIGNAGAKLEKLCRDKGLNYKGVLQVVMPENYIAMFNAPKEDEASRIVKAASRVLDRNIDVIKKGEFFSKNKVSIVDKLKTGPVNPVFYKFFVKDKAFYSTDACIACGKCEELCVLNNINLKEGKPVWKGNCTHCMACICNCPAEAIEYGNKTKGKPRYRLE